MAEIEGEILGNIKGKLGNIVFRKLNGKTVLSVRPVKYKPANSKVAKNTRARFASTVSFARFVNSIVPLKEVWSKASIPGINSYQKLIKYNFKATGEDGLTTGNLITPPGIPIIIENLTLNKNQISFTVNLGNSKQTNSLCFPFQVFSIIYFNEAKIMFELQNFFDASGISETSGLNRNLYYIQNNLNNEQIALFKKYNECIIYISVISDFSNSKAVNWSSTFSAILNIH